MDLSREQLKTDIGRIIDAEEQQWPDWASVARISIDWLERLNKAGCANLIDEHTYHFLEDFDIREGSDSYAKQQRRRMKVRLR